MVRRVVRGIGLAMGLLLLLLATLVAYWALRPNRAEVDPALGAEVWPVVSDGWHNSNTHLIYWRDAFFLVHARSRFHMGNSDSRLVVRRSADGREWTEVALLGMPGEDIRDPKFAVIDDRLFLYALPNTGFEPEPYGTVVATSDDGLTWSSFTPIEPQGWLLWEPKTLDGRTWYATAYWHEHGRSALFRSTDGLTWEHVSDIHQGDRNDETANAFLPDGRMLVTARLEGDDRAWHQGSPNAATLLAVAAPPYTEWTTTRSATARLDGPALFTDNGRVYAVGRFDPEGTDQWYGGSSLLGRKRTAIYEVTPDALIHLSDLPSAGDTSYAGAVVRDGALYTTYYTSATARDYPWLLGLVTPSDILMARVPLDRLAALADARMP
ncbi:MAG: glycoside hydrolase [Candidatus Promineofilum sp.]|nr:glycoside hydrolase [Promineifilum sp.]MCW5862503.1 exo-alpha-sialidase [Anaerolineae bacterium]